MRTCSKCLIKKEHNYFDKNISCPGGITTVCKSCRYKQAQARKKSRAEFDTAKWMSRWKK